MDELGRYADDRQRRNETPTPETIEAGLRFRHGRHQAGLSQRRLADQSGISQSEISRLERGMTPGMSAYRVFTIALALGSRFPFGTCPHPHRCAWSAEAPTTGRSTRPGVMRMSDLEEVDLEEVDLEDVDDFDAAGGLTLADVMRPADSLHGAGAIDATTDAPESDAASRIESANLMPQADSDTDREAATDDGIEITESDGAGRIESRDLMPRAGSRWRPDGWWDGPQKE